MGILAESKSILCNLFTAIVNQSTFEFNNWYQSIRGPDGKKREGNTEGRGREHCEKELADSERERETQRVERVKNGQR